MRCRPGPGQLRGGDVQPPCGAGGPRIEDYFDPVTARAVLTTHHPYDFAATYGVLREVFQYGSHYVNLGYWGRYHGECEPGRDLVFRLARLAGLQPDDVLSDIGSGLGQAAIDLISAYDLARVHG